jgi:hypothetical protein
MVARKSACDRRVDVSDTRVFLHLLIRHRLLLAALVVSTVVGAACAKLNTGGNLTVGAATTQVLVDAPDASILKRRALPQDISTLQARAVLYGSLLTTTPVLEAVGKRAAVPPDQIFGVARTTADVTIALTEQGSEERASQIQGSRAPYRLEMQAEPGEPILSIYAEAPSFEEAQHLANAAITGLRDYLEDLAREQGFPEESLPQLRQLGSPRGGVTNGKARIVIGGLTFVTAFALCFGLLLILLRRLRRRDDDDEGPPLTAPRSRLTGRAAADWPHTSRVLPWAIAALITMFWLTPFDKIQLAMSTPIDLTLDRLVLPVVAAIWLIAFAAGPGAAPRVRITRVHLAICAYLACAFLSVVLEARYLNQTGELMLSLKKLPLLISYLSIFVIVASSVRRTEVPAFLTYTLVLSVVVAVGIIYESRFSMNIFTTWSDKLFPGPFEIVADIDGSGVDSLGRRWIGGPAAYGVEAVGMMAMAMPIALVGIMGSRSRMRRLLYGLAIVLLLAAMFSTQRKSALIAPVAVIGTIAYFRRRELLSLAPFGLVIVVLVAALSPSAVHNVIAQFTRSDASKVATVSDRAADYDAIRPDLWTNLALGRGFGSYNHETYRILDSEVLSRAIETGVLGLATFLVIAISVILLVRKTVSARDPRWAPAALCGAGAAVCLLVLATLYDVMAVPHGPCVFLYLAGLAVAVVSPGMRDGPLPSAAPSDHHVRRHVTSPQRPLQPVRRRAIHTG